LPAVFNVGWAFVQISNMALVNSITFSTQRRDRLISLRNGFTYVANLTVLSIALVLFSLMKDQILQFRLLAIIIVVGGGCSSFFYIFTLKEPALVKEAKNLQKEFRRN
jgi:Na+/melibiose symporter-like transporter